MPISSCDTAVGRLQTKASRQSVESRPVFLHAGELNEMQELPSRGDLETFFIIHRREVHSTLSERGVMRMRLDLSCSVTPPPFPPCPSTAPSAAASQGKPRCCSLLCLSLSPHRSLSQRHTAASLRLPRTSVTPVSFNASHKSFPFCPHPYSNSIPPSFSAEADLSILSLLR